MNRDLLWAIGIIIAGYLIYGMISNNQYNKPKEIVYKQEYKWVNAPDHEMFIEISRTIVKHNILGCGDFYIRKTSPSNDKFLVACSSDGENFNFYHIWPNTQKIEMVQSNGIDGPEIK